jgi:hypothetical protein
MPHLLEAFQRNLDLEEEITTLKMEVAKLSFQHELFNLTPKVKRIRYQDDSERFEGSSKYHTSIKSVGEDLTNIQSPKVNVGTSFETTKKLQHHFLPEIQSMGSENLKRSSPLMSPLKESDLKISDATEPRSSHFQMQFPKAN